jgi:hypothetical protein
VGDVATLVKNTSRNRSLFEKVKREFARYDYYVHDKADSHIPMFMKDAQKGRFCRLKEMLIAFEKKRKRPRRNNFRVSPLQGLAPSPKVVEPG